MKLILSIFKIKLFQVSEAFNLSDYYTIMVLDNLIAQAYQAMYYIYGKKNLQLLSLICLDSATINLIRK